MRKFFPILAVSCILLGFAVVIGVAVAHSGGGNPVASSIGTGKQFDTPFPSYVGTPKKVAKTPGLPPFASCPTTPVPERLVPTPLGGVVQSPYNAPYGYNNAADGLVNGITYSIGGGWVLADPQQGVISVAQYSNDACKVAAQQSTPVPVTVVPMPTKHGAITLTDISGATVSFMTADGTTGHFNFLTKTYGP